MAIKTAVVRARLEPGLKKKAEKISSFVSLNEGLRTTAYSHERIMVVE